MRNGNHTIGLFQGIFERNVLTFNPGWNSQAEAVTEFQDVRVIQQQLKAQGLTLVSEVDESSDGPASLMLLDPDENPILIDQHI